MPSDDVTALDVATDDEEALVLYACARALQWIALDEAKRQRFERERGAEPADIAAGVRAGLSGAGTGATGRGSAAPAGDALGIADEFKADEFGRRVMWVEVERRGCSRR